jgi:NAD(P)-dependent dehydrogenase (short-subunit alcohol dehydrogenase family)
MAGKTALVTGAGAGIGKAIAIAFGREGATVAVADIDRDAGVRTVEEIQGNGGKGRFIECDVARSNEVQAMIQTSVASFGRLDFACNNAGVREPLPSPLAEVSESVFDRIIEVNLRGVFLCMKYEIQQMLKQGGGTIVNISSIGGLYAWQDGSPYIASKHGVMGLTKAAAIDYAKAGIRVNAVCPGVIETEMVAELPEEWKQMMLKMHPVGRFGKPEEVAGTVMWLCSDLARFVTGTGVLIDGGGSTGARV